jgi:tRNA(Ile2) C34 agmatinyltransferase TiaS
LSTMTLFIGIDDTDTLESHGTGHLARQIAAALSTEYTVLGVTRHQLLVDPRVPCTKNNSSAAIVLDRNGKTDTGILLEQIKALMLDHYQPGSDPGLCVSDVVAPAITEFGRCAQRELVTRADAQSLAAGLGIRLVGLGGDHSGIIGALAAVGLAASAEDGRYVLVGRSRELNGLQPVSAVLAAGIASVRTLAGQPVTEGLIQTDKLRPARRDGQPVAVVEWSGGFWQPLKLD